MEDKITILGICGSLRKDSYNMALLKTAQTLTQPNATITIFDRIGELPLYNQDREADFPKAALDLKIAIRAADALLFSTPEYNYSVPGVLKNAIDWASRPYGDSAWDGKPAAIMGASPGITGSARAQYHLRQICVYLNIFPLNQPEIIVPNVTTKFGERGRLIDAYTIEKLRDLVVALTEWTFRLIGKQI
ncbi:NAD(P)H-dependent oxidoreductase [Candidatus Roizmanbacteria bacterium]|nr:NAD(P)H-dependent oxidoreductase [Candidatus Roizmanbacteria bacterium]